MKNSKFERWVSYFVGVSLALFALSIIWLFTTGRLFEPNVAWRYLEMSVAGVFAALGFGWAAWNWIQEYKR